jgi:hypothetical protein
MPQLRERGDYLTGICNYEWRGWRATLPALDAKFQFEGTMESFEAAPIYIGVCANSTGCWMHHRQGFQRVLYKTGEQRTASAAKTPSCRARMKSSATLHILRVRR